MRAGRVFLSYSHVDRPTAQAVSKALNEREVEVWNSEESIEHGEGIASALRSMISESDVVVVFLSQDSINSPGLLFEAGAAIGQDKKVVVVTLSLAASRVLPLGLDEVARISTQVKSPAAIADRIAAILLEDDDGLLAARKRALEVLHVTPRTDGRWAVVRSGAKRASSVHERKSDAVKVARDAARRGQSDLVVHSRDGRIVQRDSFRKDPSRSKR